LFRSFGKISFHSEIDMTPSPQAKNILAHIHPSTKLGDLRKMAKTINKDHELAMEFWSTGQLLPRQLAILIMDKKLLSQELINQLDKDMQEHPFNERTQLM